MFLNGKNANNKVHRWLLELITYNITFEWISGAHNKAADCLSWLVNVMDTPVTFTTSINILVTSTPDSPTTCTHSKTCTPTDTMLPTDVKSTSNTDNVSAPPPLMENCKDTLWLMQRTDPFCKCISKLLWNGKTPSHEVDTFTHIKGLLYKHVMDSNQKFLVLVIPKSWHFTVLVEACDKLGQQGANRTYQLIKWQYYRKGMNKDICKYITNCALCKRGKVRTQWYPLQMTNLPDRPFDKIAIDLASDLNVSTSGNQHILTIIGHLTGWPEAFPIPDKKADTNVHILINSYLPIHMCPHFILSDNGTEFKNQLMDNVLQQPGIDHIFSALYHSIVMEVFNKYLKSTLKKLCGNDPDNWSNTSTKY